MKLQFSGVQPQFGKRDCEEMRARHFNAPQREARLSGRNDVAPRSWGSVDIFSMHNGKEVHQHLELNRDQASRVLEQTMALQAAMLHHEFSRMEGLVDSPPEDTFTRHPKHEKHDVLKK
jgi:hypothetical protein